MSDRTCKYCAAEIRWCRDDGGHWIPLDVAKIPVTETGAEYVVLGVDDARRILKANRARHGSLYRRHQCEQGKNARALQKREQADRAEGNLIRRQIAHEQATLPNNVKSIRTWRKRT